MADVFFGDDHQTDEDVLVLDETVTGLAARVVLYNDEEHTLDEVATQIIKATGCSYKRADVLTWEVHTRGKAVIYTGEMGECLRVSSVLEEIALHTQVEM